jgi:tubulin beta
MRQVFSVYDSHEADSSPLSVYNEVRVLWDLIENADSVVPVYNSSLQRVCEK